MSGKAAVAAMMLAGGAYLYWQRRDERRLGRRAVAKGKPLDQPPPLGSTDPVIFTAADRLTDIQAQYAPQQSGGTDMKFNFGPILSWGLGQLGDLFGGSRNKSGPGAPPSSWPTTIWENYDTTARSGAQAGEYAASVGGTATVRGSGIVGALQSLIGQAEAPQGYNQVYGGARLQPPRPITTMTVGEVQDYQTRMVADGSPSSAVGRYQVIRGTLQDMVNRGAVSPDDLFDADTQDRISVALMDRRGLRDYWAGRISAETFGQRLAQEWAGLPAMKRDRKGRRAQGQSYYAGDGLNAATVSRSRVLGALGAGGELV